MGNLPQLLFLDMGPMEQKWPSITDCTHLITTGTAAKE